MTKTIIQHPQHMILNILGVNISNLTQSETLSRARNFLVDGDQHLIFTPNPEMLVDSQTDWFFKTALNKADLAPADGFGLVLAARYLYPHTFTAGWHAMWQEKKEPLHVKSAGYSQQGVGIYKFFLNRFPGVELMEKICELAAQEGKSVYLVGGKEGIAAQTASVLLKRFPGLKIVGAEEGIVLKCQIPNVKCQIKSEFQNSKYQIPNTKYMVNVDFDEEENKKLLNRINQAKPDILFVAFGHKKQEKWLAEFINELPSVKIGMGVGGSFDYISGKIRRAPRFIRQMGFEWLWRLIQEPCKRIRRIWKAIISFGFLIYSYKKQIAKPHRQGATGFIINSEGNFFIAKRRCAGLDIFDQWQPPQGGIDKNETAENAVLREIKEETGITAVRIVAKCSQAVSYDWAIAYMRRACRGKYRGQTKQIFLLQYFGDGSDIKVDKHEFDDYKWITLEEYKKILHPFRRESLDIMLKECGHLISK